MAAGSESIRGVRECARLYARHVRWSLRRLERSPCSGAGRCPRGIKPRICACSGAGRCPRGM